MIIVSFLLNLVSYTEEAMLVFLQAQVYFMVIERIEFSLYF